MRSGKGPSQVNEDENVTPWFVAGMAVVISLVSLFMSIGPCVRQEKVENKVEHLETRLDNLRDRSE